MSISDWSSDVCSSDLDRQRRPEGVPGRPAPYQAVLAGGHREGGDVVAQRQAVVAPPGLDEAAEQDHDVDHRREAGTRQEIGRASRRERGCQNVYIWAIQVYVKKKNNRKTAS